MTSHAGTVLGTPVLSGCALAPAARVQQSAPPAEMLWCQELAR